MIAPGDIPIRRVQSNVAQCFKILIFFSYQLKFDFHTYIRRREMKIPSIIEAS